MPARTRRIVHDANTRAKIQATQLINRLTSHAMGKIELTNSQVRSIEVLLRKVLPDLQATTIDMTVDDRRSVDEYSINELEALARRCEGGDRPEDSGPSGPAEVH